MTIHVYGDSFGADHDEGTWPWKLSKLQKEKLICNAVGGTGPNHALEKFFNHLENKKLKDYDKVVILLSDQKRLDFPFTKEFYSGIFRIGSDDPLDEIINRTLDQQREWNIKNRGEDMYEYGKEIQFMAKSLGPMFVYENLKNILLLKFIADQYKKIRFIVFTCFTLNNCLQHYTNFRVKSLMMLMKMNLDLIQGDNFDYIKTPVISMAGMRAGDEKKGGKNHMTIEDNMRFAQLVYDIINFNDYDTSWFADDYYVDGVEIDRIGERRDKRETFFLYE
jgi:hypothetical protein